LKKTTTGIDDTIRYVPPIFLDKVSAELGAWSGYHVLAQYLIHHMIKYINGN